MKSIKIKQSHHSPGILTNINKPFNFSLDDEIVLYNKFEFTEESIYYLHKKQINKLMGISLGINPFKCKNKLICPPHHYNSVRVGFRFDQKTKQFVLLDYRYVKGKRLESTEIFMVETNEPFEVYITINPEHIKIFISSIPAFDNSLILPNYYRIVDTQREFICYLIGVYFGGKEKAPYNWSMLAEKPIPYIF